jgi:hypothetical protein
MDFATVPKATINEDREPPLVEHEIRLSKNLLISPPPLQIELSENCNETKLCCEVTATSHPRHNFRAFTSGKDVRHWPVVIRRIVLHLLMVDASAETSILRPRDGE